MIIQKQKRIIHPLLFLPQILQSKVYISNILLMIKKFSLLPYTVVLIFSFFFPFLTLCSQSKQIEKEIVQRIKVHGKGLEGNLEGDSVDRYVSVYLPARYKSNPNRKYPVIYFLHGYTNDDAKWYGFKKH